MTKRSLELSRRHFLSAGAPLLAVGRLSGAGSPSQGQTESDPVPTEPNSDQAGTFAGIDLDDRVSSFFPPAEGAMMVFRRDVNWD